VLELRGPISASLSQCLLQPYQVLRAVLGDMAEDLGPEDAATLAGLGTEERREVMGPVGAAVKELIVGYMALVDAAQRGREGGAEEEKGA
jgi:hypothetical protein